MARPPTYPSARPTMDTRILLALRAGPLTPQQLEERLGGQVSVSKLIHRGLVEADGDASLGVRTTEYRLTAAGRAACPRWRDICKPCMEALE